MGRKGALRHMLANAAALLGVVLFLAHGVAAGGFLAHGHGPTLAQADLALVAPHIHADTGHEHAEGVAPDHQTPTGTSSACCGDACLSALMPGDMSCTPPAWDDGAKRADLFVLLRGRAPEGLRRPPRLSL